MPIGSRRNLRSTWAFAMAYQSGWSEAQNKFGVFDKTIMNPATNTPGGMVFGGQNGRNAIQDNVYDETAPRVGIAWSPTENLPCA